MSKKRSPQTTVYTYGKKNKKKIKTTLEKVSFLSFRLESLVYNNNSCQIMVLKSVM